MDSMRRVNPEGVMMPRLSIQTARRRQYSVPAPNHLWHIDGNHKLIRSVLASPFPYSIEVTGCMYKIVK